MALGLIIFADINDWRPIEFVKRGYCVLHPDHLLSLRSFISGIHVIFEFSVI